MTATFHSPRDRSSQSSVKSWPVASMSGQYERLINRTDSRGVTEIGFLLHCLFGELIEPWCELRREIHQLFFREGWIMSVRLQHHFDRRRSPVLRAARLLQRRPECTIFQNGFGPELNPIQNQDLLAVLVKRQQSGGNWFLSAGAND